MKANGSAHLMRAVCITAALSPPLAIGPAKADWCETAPGSQTYTDQNCAKQDHIYDLSKSRSTPQKASEKKESLRSKLKRALARKAEHDKAAQAAVVACESGDAKAFRDAMGIALKTGDDDQNTRSTYGQFVETCEAKFADTPAEPPPAAVVAVPSAIEPDDPLGGWPAECRAAAARLVAGGRRKDGVAASSAYAALHDDRTCSPYLSSLAGRAGARLPERKMSDRSRRALQQAMSGDADELVGAVGDRAYDASYDPSEVLDFGLALFGSLANVRGGGLRGVSAMRSLPRAPAAAPSQASRPSLPPHQSDITGLSH